MTTSYEAVIGLEVHAQLATRTKLFCGCATAYSAVPNQNTCPCCLALPGALPVLNKRAVELAVRAALALGGSVQAESVFARKNYFYPDLPKGYQISQYDRPFNLGGHVDIEVDGKATRIALTRIHLEEDAAKNLHGAGDSSVSLVDYNRAGVPLIEIVSEPELRSAVQAEAYLKRLREVLMAVGVNDGNLEEGSFRCDANVSLRPWGQEAFGTRAELKNINSFRFVRKAIDYEIGRQEALLSAGERIVQETRTWNEAMGKTVSMRGKEEAHDYRYFPCPDLPPLRLEPAYIEKVAHEMPELPEARRQRWQRDFGLTAYDAAVLSGHPATANFVDACVAALAGGAGDKDTAPVGGKAKKLGKKVANFVQSELLRHVKTQGLEAEFPVSAPALAALLGLVEDGTINGKIAKEVFAEMAATGASAQQVVDRKGLSQVTDVASIEAEVKRVLAANAKEVERYRGGKTSVFGFFVGQVMKATRGAANPKIVNETLKRLLDSV
ncbi:MAG: Asp-tRNA(Asn)/Glu-tRNA(Gln) amidotransferase subunit GatB [Polyangiales bacterium]